ncbi:MAG TPA: LPS export ABC transporter permease LptG [Candidatus Methylomirabilis sp.]|nr:LPS export ABC transporter permease LptG [Candidatus Methylomirabilis sp.]
MRLLDSYIGRECLKILCLCLVLFTGVYLIVDLFEKFSRFLEAQVPPAMILRYYLFRLPKIFTEVLPIAILLASLLSLGGLARHNELLAMKMGHVSTLRIALPCIAMGLLASLAAWVTTEYVAPRTNERAMNIERTDVRRLPAHRTTRDSDIWYRAQGNRFVHISLIESQSGLIRGMSVFQLSPTFDLVQRVDAREATWGADGWTLRDGYQLDLTQTPVRVTPFQTLRIALSERPEEFARVARSPEEMSYSQLRGYIERLVQSGVSATRYRVDLEAKIAIALVSLIMALIGVSFGLRTGKGGVMIWVGVCIPMGFLYWMLLSMGFSLGRGGVLPPLVAAWLPNLVFGVGGLLSLWRLRG